MQHQVGGTTEISRKGREKGKLNFKKPFQTTTIPNAPLTAYQQSHKHNIKFKKNFHTFHNYRQGSKIN
jgi:hypothetical protein